MTVARKRVLVLGVPDLGEGLARPGMGALGSAPSTFAILWSLCQHKIHYADLRAMPR